MFGTTVIAILITGLCLTAAQRTGGSFYGPIMNETAVVEDNGACVNNKGQVIPEGFLYTPGLDECQVCRCLKQMPVMCRTVLCAPPTNCLRLRVGSACCQWICDDWDKENFSDIGLRLVASGVTAILSLSLLFFLVYRLRQRRLRGRQNHFQAENFNSELGSVDHSWYGDHQVSHMGGGWRKPFTQFSRPFPPSYDEAVMANSSMMEEPAPQYPGDPVIPYQVATLGRQVLPPVPEATYTLPSRLRRIRNPEPAQGQLGGESLPPHIEEGQEDAGCHSAADQNEADTISERLSDNSSYYQPNSISHNNTYTCSDNSDTCESESSASQNDAPEKENIVVTMQGSAPVPESSLSPRLPENPPEYRCNIIQSDDDTRQQFV